MIGVQRLARPPILQRKATEWTTALQNATSDSDRRKIVKRYKHKQIKDALKEMFRGKCAYCESHISHIDYGHIEHFKPKSRFRELTFEWNNLLLSCAVCNGSQYKGDKFPETSFGEPIVNPCDENPEDHFKFFYDPIVGLASVYGSTERGIMTEKLLGLNRHDLRSHRSQQVKRLYCIFLMAHEDEEARSLIQDACSESSEYAAFARTIAKAS